MTPRLRSRHAASGQRWIFSYADVVTILLVLFVAIAARGLAKVEPPKPLPAAAPAPADVHPDLVEVRQALEAKGLHPQLDARGLVVTLPQAVLFPSGLDEVSPTALPVVEHVAEAIRGIPNRITVIGHADAVPIHNKRFRDNWMLSVARGMRLLELFRSDYGIPQERLSVAGYGSYSPREANDTEESRAANRRVEIIILPL